MLHRQACVRKTWLFSAWHSPALPAWEAKPPLFGKHPGWAGVSDAHRKMQVPPLLPGVSWGPAKQILVGKGAGLLQGLPRAQTWSPFDAPSIFGVKWWRDETSWEQHEIPQCLSPGVLLSVKLITSFISSPGAALWPQPPPGHFGGLIWQFCQRPSRQNWLWSQGVTVTEWLVVKKALSPPLSQPNPVQPSRISHAKKTHSLKQYLLGLFFKDLDRCVINSNPRPSLEACWLKHPLNFMCEVHAGSNTAITVTAALTKALRASGITWELQEEQREVTIIVQLNGDSALLCTVLVVEGLPENSLSPTSTQESCDFF